MGIKEILNGMIEVIDKVEDWKEAIDIIGQLMINKNKIKVGYIKNIIENIEELGPYIIIAPGIALPHARPSENVLENALALLKINNGVKFTKDGENIYLIFCLAAKDSNSHIDIIEQLTLILNDDEKIEKLKSMKSLEEIEKVL